MLCGLFGRTSGSKQLQRPCTKSRQRKNGARARSRGQLDTEPRPVARWVRPDSLIRRRERKEHRPWSFISALWAGDDGVVVIVHRHRYVRLPTLRTAASDRYDYVFGHMIPQTRNASSDHLITSADVVWFPFFPQAT